MKVIDNNSQISMIRKNIEYNHVHFISYLILCIFYIQEMALIVNSYSIFSFYLLSFLYLFHLRHSEDGANISHIFTLAFTISLFFHYSISFLFMLIFNT